MKSIKVLLVDDHQIILDGIRNMLAEEKDIIIIGACLSAKEAFEIVLENKPDIIITDIMMPDMNGIDFVKKLRANNIHTKVLILSMFASADYIQTAVQAGVNGFLMKQNATRNELMTALYNLSENKNYFNSDVASAIITGLKSDINEQGSFIEKKVDDILSKRELQVLKFFAEGYSNKEISEKLFISQRTVETHKTNMITKLNLRSYVDLVKYAIKNNISDF
jgi:DNA-binding NarL/FixJ family response regulator